MPTRPGGSSITGRMNATNSISGKNNKSPLLRGPVVSSRTVFVPETFEGLPVTSIGNRAFSGSGLTGITLPASLTSIGEYAFSSSYLTRIDLPVSLTSVGEHAFETCESLKDVTFPASLTSIGKYAFSLCSSLTEIAFPSSLESLGEFAFFAARASRKYRSQNLSLTSRVMLLMVAVLSTRFTMPELWQNGVPLTHGITGIMVPLSQKLFAQMAQ